jgi:ABC-type transport system involved in multi-copper enzyme maturation permease subunit
MNLLLSLLGVLVLGLAAWFCWESKSLLVPASLLAWILTVLSFDTAMAVMTVALKAFFGLGQSGAHVTNSSGQ